MIDLDESAREMAEERAAIREYDGLMIRAEAERLGKLDSDEWRHVCEVRLIMRMSSLEERREYFRLIEQSRGKPVADALRESVQRAWLARKAGGAA